MLALSRLLSTGILLFLVAFFVWVYALMKTSKRADAFMDQRWLERQWLADHHREQWYADHGFITAEEFQARYSEFYDQEDER